MAGARAASAARLTRGAETVFAAPMQDGVITDIADITAEWLAGVLGRAPALERGTVVDVVLAAERTTNSEAVRITVTYSPDARGTLPARLFLKLCSAANASTGVAFGNSEVRYYAEDYVALRNGPVPETFHVRYSAKLGAYHILMRDYSATHTPAWNLTPTACPYRSTPRGCVKK